jgi:hypothetical protein
VGIAHYRLRNWDEAISAIQHAYKIKPEKRQDVDGQYFLAMALFRSGDEAEARRWYQSAKESASIGMSPDTRNFHREAAELLGIDANSPDAVGNSKGDGTGENSPAASEEPTQSMTEVSPMNGTTDSMKFD